VESNFGLGYKKLSMESKGDHPGISTFSLIYWNHFFKSGTDFVPYGNQKERLKRKKERNQKEKKKKIKKKKKKEIEKKKGRN